MKNSNVKFDDKEVFVGIDIAKDSLAVFVSLGRKNHVFENNRKDHRKIVKLCKRLNPVRICLEATGGYETALMLALSEEELNVSMANPKRVREFAKAHGFLYKSDPIDAEMLGVFGKQVRPPVTIVASEEHREMSALSRRREQLIKMITSEKNRLPLAHIGIRRELKGHIRYLQARLLKIEEKIDTIFTNSSLLGNAELIESIPGVGKISSYALVTELPELGHASNRTISALAGVAPFTQR